MKPTDIPQQPQRQDSVQDQLDDLIVWANRLGMYDIADIISSRYVVKAAMIRDGDTVILGSGKGYK